MKIKATSWKVLKVKYKNHSKLPHQGLHKSQFNMTTENYVKHNTRKTGVESSWIMKHRAVQVQTKDKCVDDITWKVYLLKVNKPGVLLVSYHCVCCFIVKFLPGPDVTLTWGEN